MAIGRVGRGVAGHVLVVNSVVHLIILGLAGWSLDKYINGEQNHPHLGGNMSTSFLLMFALIASAVGACSVFAGFVHFRAWKTESLASAGPLALISSAVTSLAFGYAFLFSLII
ncbi:uncharacterized protein LOC110807244 [Carica papaya]|uniref:uncharacterized protein LOC110807244 n=1 Tax=Carica papaya TaxID=3649 RepID=UPI000B8D0F57|nr:uncharacterized protein LOC110807244 [Carica papaya]